MPETHAPTLRYAAQAALDLIEYATKNPKDAGYIAWQMGVVAGDLTAAIAALEALPPCPQVDLTDYRNCRLEFVHRPT
jgi:hypothetical protein